MDWGWSRWLKVWELKGDLTIGEKVLDIGGRKGQGFFVEDIEWVGGRLLMSIIEGYDTLWEWDKQMEEGTFAPKEVPWQEKWLLFDPKTRQIIDLGVNEDLLGAKLFAHPSEDKVLIVKLRGGRISGMHQIKIVSLPLVSPVKPDIAEEFRFPRKQVGEFFSPLEWAPDGRHFWALGTDEHGYLKLFTCGLDGSFRKLTPDDHWLVSGGICDIYGSLPLVIEPTHCMPSIALQGGRGYVALMSSKRHKHTCLGIYSLEKLEKEYVIVGWDIPYPKELKSLGECTLIAVTPYGRLILQEGRFAPYGEKRRVWVWDIQTGTVRPLAQVGWIEKVYGWIGTEWMVVGMRGELFDVEVEYDVGERVTEKRATYEYGLLHVPKG
ncbi:MAG: hypothetical protein QXS01_05170 [Candidatus Bathyarchaeia archaeon]